MVKVKILIVEDELITAQGIKLQLESLGYETASIVDYGEQVLDALHKYNPDLIMMDIQLSGKMDGIEAAAIVREKYTTPIIFLTDMEDQTTFDRAKQTGPAVYLNKPFNEAELGRHIELAIHNATSVEKSQNTFQTLLLNDFIWIKDGYSYKKISVKDILFLKAEGSYCRIETAMNNYVIAKNMREVLDKLNHGNFVKVHRSYVVNSRHIAELKGSILVVSGHEIPIGKTYLQSFKEKLKLI